MLTSPPSVHAAFAATTAGCYKDQSCAVCAACGTQTLLLGCYNVSNLQPVVMSVHHCFMLSVTIPLELQLVYQCYVLCIYWH